MKSQAIIDDKHARQINARFQDRLPAILDTICCSKFAVEQPLDEASVAVREFLDYLDFEIRKVSLTIDRSEWESVVDVQKVAADKEWLSRLMKLRDDFGHDGAKSSCAFMNDLIEQIRTTFKV